MAGASPEFVVWDFPGAAACARSRRPPGHRLPHGATVGDVARRYIVIHVSSTTDTVFEYSLPFTVSVTL